MDRTTRDRLIAEHPSSAEVLKPFLRGRDVKRWRVDFADQYLIKIESSENKKHPWSSKLEKDAESAYAASYPALHAFHQKFRSGLIKRADQGKYFWELRSCAYWQEFEQPKIVVPSITNSVNYAADSNGYYGNDKTSILIPKSVPYLLAILNSSISGWITQQEFASKQGGFFEFKPMYVSKFPICPVTSTEQAKLETIVRRILENPKAADVADLEAEINERVYRLYGLTRDEIAVIEAD